MSKKILVCATNYGVWAEELQAPWDALTDAGHELTIATYKGIKPLPLQISVDPEFMDPMQNYQVNPPEVCERTKALVQSDAWDNPVKFKDANMADYDAIVMAGGLGAMLDMGNNQALHRLILAALEQGKLVASICYANAVLVFTRDPKNGYKSVIHGKKIAAHCRAWDFDVDFTYDLWGATEGNKGTDLVSPGFLFPLQDLVTDAVGPEGECVYDETANREKPVVAYDAPFLTGLSVESSIAFGRKLVEVL
ncbi:MAG: type 1 glutamine amidotransferase domain-containing protein [Armatimonadia bacterium]|nr:type 1 glutamine amidotransferase domain-containing protein [Armatimonadia bacterium]